jgi:hypothetical protein
VVLVLLLQLSLLLSLLLLLLHLNVLQQVGPGVPQGLQGEVQAFLRPPLLLQLPRSCDQQR